MVALSRCLSSLALLAAGTQGARVSRKKTSAPQTKFIGGVPVFEYHAVNAGGASLSEVDGETEQEWILILARGTSDAQVLSLCKMNKNGCNHVGHPTGGVPFVELRGTEADLERVIHSDQAAVKFVTPDQQDMMIPEIEEEAGVQAATWGLNRIGADDRDRDGAGVTIYVQDTGVRATHQDFGGRASSALDVTSGSAVECNGDLNCAADRQGHGTHCAGTAGGQNYGVATAASVRAVKTLNDQGSGARSWQYVAIDWVTVSGTKPAVISMSLGGSGADPGYTTVIDAAVENGVTVVVAAGNSNSDACNFSPAFAANAITVGSTTSTDTRSSFSNYGTCVEIWAPGSSVVSLSSSSDTGTSTKSGTSMACPHVSGAAALVLGADNSKNAAAVLEELLSTAAWGAISGLRTGDTNALLFVGAGGAPPTTTPVPTPAPPPGTWEVASGTGCTKTGNCIQSNNHPANYGINEECSINAYDVDITVDAFSTESSYDILTMGGTDYSGTSGPASGTFSGVISWSSDYSVVSSGWKLCSGSSPGPVPTPAPTTQSPTPSPTTPAPTPPSPPAPTPSSGNCSSWCEPPADCVDYPYSCSGCCGGSPSPPSPPAPSPPSSGDCLSICDRESDCTGYPSICGGCSFC